LIEISLYTLKPSFKNSLDEARLGGNLSVAIVPIGMKRNAASICMSIAYVCLPPICGPVDARISRVSEHVRIAN